MIQDVAIIFLQRRMGGGTTTFTAHLSRALSEIGHAPIVYTLNRRSERIIVSNFGDYKGVQQRCVGAKEMLDVVKHMPSVLSAPVSAELLPSNFMRQLSHAGVRMVLHDPTHLPVYGRLKLERPFCIRETMLEHQKKAVFIPHPYGRVELPAPWLGKKRKQFHAVSTARVHNTKRSSMILKANELLPKKYQVKLMGKEFRLYSYGLQKRYDSFKQKPKFPLTFEAPVEICTDSRYNVDMSYFEQDGGGTQYCQLEAMDAGCANIMHEDWFRYPGTLKSIRDVITIRDVAELAQVLKDDDCDARRRVINNGYRRLQDHSYKKIGKLYAKELGL